MTEEETDAIRILRLQKGLRDVEKGISRCELMCAVVLCVCVCTLAAVLAWTLL